VNPSVSAKTLPEFIAYAKTNPGKINFASPGIGSTPHVNGELFKMMTGTNLVHVPYRSAAAVMTDLLSGKCSFTSAPRHRQTDKRRELSRPLCVL
jgi:tripartite-type tricarboxylate transporter receptor subunit TctC